MANKKRVTKERALKELAKIEKMFEDAIAKTEPIMLEKIAAGVDQKGLRLRKQILRGARRTLREVRVQKKIWAKRK